MAAGLGFKTFNTGDVLTAADTNGYLMQGVWVFANSTARTSAVTSPQEGNVSFLKDTNSFEIYDGASWVAYGSGDITGVTAGTGISGGGTSGTVTVTNSMATEITAAGDIIVGTGSGTFDNLPIGTTGQVLTADTTVSPYKVKWAAAAGGGKILQVVYANYATSTTIASTSFADTGLSATITPTAATSKVLVFVTQMLRISRSSGNGIFGVSRLLRGSTEIFLENTDALNLGILAAVGGGSECVLRLKNTMFYQDTPNTTSATTYKTQGRAETTSNSGQVIFQDQSGYSSMILMEVGA